MLPPQELTTPANAAPDAQNKDQGCVNGNCFDSSGNESMKKIGMSKEATGSERMSSFRMCMQEAKTL